MGKGRVRFKSLEDLALDVRSAGRELYGGGPRAVASWSREVGDTVLVKTVGRSVARASAQEHMANYSWQGKEQRQEVSTMHTKSML